MASPICTRVAPVAAPRLYVDSKMPYVPVTGLKKTRRKCQKAKRMLEWYVERSAALPEAVREENSRAKDVTSWRWLEMRRNTKVWRQ